jgi:hypothetical protein
MDFFFHLNLFLSFSLNENPNIHRTTESDDADSNAWFDASPEVTEKQEIVHQQFRDIDSQNPSLPQLSSTELELENLKVQIQQIALEHPVHFPHSTNDPSENLNQITSLLKNLQNEINDLHR